MTAASDTIAYPIAVIDFEASALTLDSFPIEVGLAVLAAPGDPIVTWSSLIRPDQAWDIDAQWDPDAERIHGIRRWSLRESAEPRVIIAELNARIPGGSQVWCDGGRYDQHWLGVLVAAAGIGPEFTLHDLGAALRNDPALHTRYLAAGAGTARPHRAEADAAIIGAAIAAAMEEPSLS